MSNVIFFLIVVLITSCSTVDDMSCHTNDYSYYLKTNSLCEITFPDDLILSDVEDKYKIPNVAGDRKHLNFGKNLNICPPNVVY